MKKKERTPQEVEIDLLPLLKALLAKVWLMIIVGAILAGLAFGAAKLLIKPTYRSGFTAYVNNQHAQSSKDSLTYSDLTASQQLTQTYSYMLRSNSVLTAAAASINSNLSYGELKKKVMTEIQDETEIISVYVIDEDPEFAYQLATAISKTAPEYMTEFVEGSSMKIIDYPVWSNSRYGPSYMKYAVLAFLVGVLIVIIKTIVEYFKDDKIKSEQDIEERFDIPILGIIPDVFQIENGRPGYYEYNYSSKKDNRSGKNNEK